MCFEYASRTFNCMEYSPLTRLTQLTFCRLDGRSSAACQLRVIFCQDRIQRWRKESSRRALITREDYLANFFLMNYEIEFEWRGPWKIRLWGSPKVQDFSWHLLRTRSEDDLFKSPHLRFFSDNILFCWCLLILTSIRINLTCLWNMLLYIQDFLALKCISVYACWDRSELINVILCLWIQVCFKYEYYKFRVLLYDTDRINFWWMHFNIS